MLKNVLITDSFLLPIHIDICIITGWQCEDILNLVVEIVVSMSIKQISYSFRSDINWIVSWMMTMSLSCFEQLFTWDSIESLTSQSFDLAALFISLITLQLVELLWLILIGSLIEEYLRFSLFAGLPVDGRNWILLFYIIHIRGCWSCCLLIFLNSWIFGYHKRNNWNLDSRDISWVLYNWVASTNRAVLFFGLVNFELRTQSVI